MDGKNEEELMFLRETKNDLSQINYKYSEMKEKNPDERQNLKKIREKFDTVMGSDEDNKKIYNNVINELNKEIQNQLQKVEELKTQLNKEKENDDKTQEEINRIYNQFKNNQDLIKINEDLFKVINKNNNNNDKSPNKIQSC